MATHITDSPNITILDSRIYADLCGGNFLVDVGVSTFLPGGASTSGGVQGASVKITNPLGVVIRNYITSGFDIYPPMTSVFSYAIPLIALNYQYGTYIIDVRLTDHDGTQYYISKSVNICPPDPNNKTKKEGCLNASINANCKDGKVVILLNQPPNYKNTAFTSEVISLTVEYPTASGLPEFDAAYGSFSVALYEGQYIVTGTDCVLYDLGDYVYIKVKYKINCSKIVKCIVDMCCVQAQFDWLNSKLDTDCSFNEKQVTLEIITLSQFYINAAQGAADCGSDPSVYIDKLEKLLGCVCTCNCNEGTPIIDTTPAEDISIEGCNVDVDTIGLTKVYTINNYRYQLINDDTNNLISVGALVLDGCTYKQHININAANLLTSAGVRLSFYRALISQAGSAAPVPVNSTSNTVTVIWTRISAGQYRATFTGLVTPLSPTNIFVITGSGGATTGVGLDVFYESANTLTAKVSNSLDGQLNNCPIEISYL